MKPQKPLPKGTCLSYQYLRTCSSTIKVGLAVRITFKDLTHTLRSLTNGLTRSDKSQSDKCSCGVTTSNLSPMPMEIEYEIERESQGATPYCGRERSSISSMFAISLMLGVLCGSTCSMTEQASSHEDLKKIVKICQNECSPLSGF